MMTTELPMPEMKYQYTGQISGNTQDGTTPPMPQAKEIDKIYGICVRQLDHGYIVEVGCKTFAIENAGRLAALISQYLLTPAETFDNYQKGKLL